MAVGVVVNPAAGGGRLSNVWPELQRMLEDKLGPLSVLETSHTGEGRDLAARHVREGAALVIAAGGDGTANEVVDGLLLAGGGSELGVISVGTGRDFVRTLGGVSDPKAAIEAIGSGRTRRIDAGRVTFRDDVGNMGVRHFLNVASLGVSGPTVRAVNRSKQDHAVHGRISFYYHTIMELLKYRPQDVRVTFDDGEVVEQNDFGSITRVTADTFPILSGLSIKRIVVNPGAMRTPHWHANCNELTYCVAGTSLVSVLDSYVLDLQQAKTCDERRAVIGKLRELGDGRASTALRRAKAQFACIERDATDALAALEPKP